MEENFDFSEDSFFFLCRPFKLDEEMNFENVVALADKLGVQYDGDQMFSEIVTLNLIVEKLSKTATDPDRKATPCDKWANFFRKEEAPNLLQVVQHVFAVAPSNAYVESF